ncbi:MAG: hypothetical protein AB1730_28690 [Myxococcota bacterium]
MIDHLTITESDLQKAVRFYEKALEPRGSSMVMPTSGPRDSGLEGKGAFVTDPIGHPVEAVCHAPPANEARRYAEDASAGEASLSPANPLRDRWAGCR